MNPIPNPRRSNRLDIVRVFARYPEIKSAADAVNSSLADIAASCEQRIPPTGIPSDTTVGLVVEDVCESLLAELDKPDPPHAAALIKFLVHRSRLYASGLKPSSERPRTFSREGWRAELAEIERIEREADEDKARRRCVCGHVVREHRKGAAHACAICACSSYRPAVTPLAPGAVTAALERIGERPTFDGAWTSPKMRGDEHPSPVGAERRWPKFMQKPRPRGELDGEIPTMADAIGEAIDTAKGFDE